MQASSHLVRRAVVVNPFQRGGRGFPLSATRSAAPFSRNPRSSFLDAASSIALLLPIRSLNTSESRVSDGTVEPSEVPPPYLELDMGQKPLPSDAGSVKSASNETPRENATALQTTVGGQLAEKPDLSTLSNAKKDMEVEKSDNRAEKTLTVMQKIKKEAQHYWDGTILLATEVKISSRLALKMAAGYELTRREHRQLQRTVQDLGRLVPFSVFVIVPFAELLLPVALKLFPNLLPSTYEGQKSKDQKALKLRTTRKEVSHFLRQTLKETGLPLTSATAQKEEFANFFRKVRATGERPTAEDVIKVCKIFKDDVTLDNLSRPQLVSMCRYLNLNTYGSDGVLRYQIRVRMRQIKTDDRAIAYEGVDSLTVAELQTACQSRGIRTHGVSPGRLRDDLQTWLDLRLKHGVPSTLLVLSNAYMYGQAQQEGEMATQIDALTGVLSSIPEELYHEIELEVHNAEGAATNKQRLEVLKEQEDLIDEELEQNEETSKSGVAVPCDTEDIDEKEERAVHAEAEGIDKVQLKEAMDAEQDAVKASQEAVDLEKEIEKKVENSGKTLARKDLAANTSG